MELNDLNSPLTPQMTRMFVRICNKRVKRIDILNMFFNFHIFHFYIFHSSSSCSFYFSHFHSSALSFIHLIVPYLCWSEQVYMLPYVAVRHIQYIEILFRLMWNRKMVYWHKISKKKKQKKSVTNVKMERIIHLIFTFNQKWTK